MGMACDHPFRTLHPYTRAGIASVGTCHTWLCCHMCNVSCACSCARICNDWTRCRTTTLADYYAFITAATPPPPALAAATISTTAAQGLLRLLLPTKAATKTSTITTAPGRRTFSMIQAWLVQTATEMHTLTLCDSRGEGVKLSKANVTFQKQPFKVYMYTLRSRTA